MPLGFSIDNNWSKKDYSFGDVAAGGGYISQNNSNNADLFNQKERDIDLSQVSAFCNPNVA